MGFWHFRSVTLGLTGALCLLTDGALAQSVVPDGTLGVEGSTVARDVLIRGILSDRIEGGATRGANLFHSFEQFNVDAGRGVYFVDPVGVETILSRVTGAGGSEILGRLGVLGDASLFLINPNGIVFGPGASLDIAGSFVATTADGVRLGADGWFSASEPQGSSLLAVAPGALLYNQIAAQGGRLVSSGSLAAGQDLTLAGANVEVQGSVQAGRDLTLEAQDTVRIRDSAAAPFVGSAGRNLTIQGNQGIDILALSNSQTQFKSGGDLSLISDGLISGDAHFNSGGDFQIRSVSGQLANFTSLYDPIISSAGNVDIAGGYGGTTGAASLLIEAQGSVRIQGEIFITTPDTISTFVGSDAILSTQPGLIIRSGQPNLVYGGTNQGNPPVSNNNAIPNGITLESAVRVQPNIQGGIVRLSADNGGITFSSINTSSSMFDRAGDIELKATNDIANTGSFAAPFRDPVALGAFFFSRTRNSGNGGNISLVSTFGNISLINGGVSSFSESFNGGNGGKISFTTTIGNIFLLNSNSLSNVFSLSDNFGNGGEISFTTNTGNITLTNSYSDATAYSFRGNAGNGGEIFFVTDTGNITLTNSSSYSSSSSSAPAIFGFRGDVGNGGKISFVSIGGNITLTSSFLSSYSHTFSGNSRNGGEISLTTVGGNITLTSSFLTSNSLSGLFSFSSSSNAGNGGAISLNTTTGDITLTDASLFSNSSSISDSLPLSVSGNVGDGGTISLNTTTGNIALTNLELDSSTFSDSGNTGNGGAITLKTKDGTIIGNTSRLNSYAVSTRGSSGTGGKVTLQAQNEISGLDITTLSSGGISGDVEINGFGNLLIAETFILTAQEVNIKLCPTCDPTTINLRNTGQAGNVSVYSTGNLSFSNSVIQSDTRSINPAGNVTIASPGLIGFDNSRVISNTNSSGQAGSITVDAGQGIEIVGANSGLFAQTTSAGTAGNITLNAPQITLQRDAQISTTATATSTNRDRGGSITLNASNLNLAGTVGVFAETQGQTPAGTLILNPYQNQPDLNITLTPSAKISASTSGSGNGGDLILTAPRTIAISGPGQLAVETSGTGNAGNITLTAPQLTLSDGVELSASSSSPGKAGDIRITADAVDLLTGARVSSSTSDRGAAGNITVNASDRLTLSDTGTGFFASTTADSTGSGGSITLNTGNLTLTDRSQISAQSLGLGRAGDITITANGLLNANNSNIITTAQSSGGDIQIFADNIRLGGDSDITTNVINGAGGNIAPIQI